jgi:hypothetical protein
MDTTQTLTEITRSVDALATAKTGVTSALHRVEEVALRAPRPPRRDGDPDELRQVVATLYWTALDLPVKTIATVVGSPEAVRDLAGAGPALSPCRTCGMPRRARTRTELKSPDAECADCSADRQRRELEEQRRHWEERAEREDREAWLEHLQAWHADEAEDEVERQRLLDIWTQLPRWACGCEGARYAPSPRYW